MSATYITATYIDSFVGADVRAALFTDSAGDYSPTILGVQINAASALIKAYAKNSGYDLGDTTTDDSVMLATLGALMRVAYSRPDKNVAIPEGFGEHPATLAYLGILSGDMPILSATPNVGAEVGGFQFTESDPDVTDAVVRRTSKTELAGF